MRVKININFCANNWMGFTVAGLRVDAGVACLTSLLRAFLRAGFL
jgi:hypothetical protein